MRAYTALILAACLGIASATTTVKLWGQCGGKGGDCASVPGGDCDVAGKWPNVRCQTGTRCVNKDEWYSQCVPKVEGGDEPAPPTSAPTPAPAPAPVDECNVPMWGQCGGTGGDCATKCGGKCTDAAWGKCISSTCEKQSEFYWQCV